MFCVYLGGLILVRQNHCEDINMSNPIEPIEQLGLLAFGLVAGVVRGTVTGQYKHEYEVDCDEHPSECVGAHVGHAIGATVHKLFNPFSN